jgi:integrase/recombinase XerD
MDFKLSLFLDVRRKLDNGKYPIRIRAWHQVLKKAKLYRTDLSMFEEDYNNSWGSGKSIQKLKGINSKNYKKLNNLYDWALEQAEGMEYFDFDEFGKRINRTATDRTSVMSHFKRTIEDFESQNRLGSASSYKCAMVSLRKYNTIKKGKEIDIDFKEITPTWLKGYEDYMVEKKGSSITTVGIYTRTLRVIFNAAIKHRNDLDPKYYPFGKEKYMIPSSKTVKKTLTSLQVAEFYNMELPPLQEVARDYWFFSYLCRGINFKDIAMLKYKNLNDDRFAYIREKTKRTNRKEITEITIPLNPNSLKIINRYKKVYHSDNTFVFPILDAGDSPTEIFRKVNNFIRATNQQLKNIAKTAGFPKGLSTYWARHGYATNMINAGASMERIQAHLQHSDLSTTQRYFTGFDDDIKDEFMEKLIDNLNNGN